MKEFLVKGYVLDDERLKQGRHFGKDYFDDLLERIREIRTSERRYYQKITDIYAECSSDYDAKSDGTKLFFKMVQNMIHIAVTHHTAAEIVYQRADAERPNGSFFLNRKVAPEELCGKDEVHRMLTFESYLWCIHILFLLPVLILVLLQEDQFLFLNLRPKLLLRREKQLILARKYGLVVRRQCKTHGRVILLGAE